jgi:hypothetical protein
LAKYRKELHQYIPVGLNRKFFAPEYRIGEDINHRIRGKFPAVVVLKNMYTAQGIADNDRGFVAIEKIGNRRPYVPPEVSGVITIGKSII